MVAFQLSVTCEVLVPSLALTPVGGTMPRQPVLLTLRALSPAPVLPHALTE